MSDAPAPLFAFAPLLHNDRVRLAAPVEADLVAATRWYTDEHFVRMLSSDVAMPVPHPYLRAAVNNPRGSDEARSFTVRALPEDVPIGECALTGIRAHMGTCYLAIGIGDAAYRGQGYGGAALALLVGFAFRELNLRRVSLTVFAYNTSAVRLYERFGFVREGTMREALHRDGATHDMFSYGLLRREWETCYGADGQRRA